MSDETGFTNLTTPSGPPRTIRTEEATTKEGIKPKTRTRTRYVPHDRYIKEVLPVAVKYGNHVFGND